MKPEIVVCNRKILAGIRQSMTFANYDVSQLWKSFIPRKQEIKNCISSDLFSIAVYKPDHFSKFDPKNEFEKWAAVEVPEGTFIPDGLEKLVLEGGLYAVFLYKGLNTDHRIFNYIFETWLPSSGYTVDTRPHFEILGNKYKNNDASSEEEIWIPIK